jgi:hypothetical protein
VVLTLPDGAEERRLKCPKCGTRFRSVAGGMGRPESSGAQSRPASAPTITLKTGQDEPGVPTAEHDLRETFAPDLLFGEGQEKKPAAKPSQPASGGAAGDIADAAALFAGDEPKPGRRGPTAEARSKPRRCPSCSSVVPAGMSLCNRCGLDLDSGRRTVLDEILEPAPPPPAPAGPPLPIAVLGGVVLIASLALGLLALVESMRPGASQGGFLSLAAIGFFGVYAAVQFLRLRSARLILIALMLGAVINVIALIALPIYRANSAPPTQATPGAITLDDEDRPKFENVASRLDVAKLKWGIAILVAEAGAMIYLLSPSVKRLFEKHSRALAPVGVF